MISQLARLQLENFLTWRSLDWRPSLPIACLIGENDSGKSNLLRSFEFLADCAKKPFTEVFHQHRRFSDVASPDSSWFRVSIDGTHLFKEQSLEFRYQLKVGESYESGPAIVDEEVLVLGDYELHREPERFYVVQNGERQSDFPISAMQTLLNRMLTTGTDQLEMARALTNSPARAFAQDISHFLTLRLNATEIRTACEPDVLPMPSGKNLAAALDLLSSNPEYRASFDSIQQRVRELLPRIHSVGVKSFRDGAGTSKRLLKFGTQSAGKPFYFEADAASDGTLYVLALLLFSQNPNASGISLVEEPELGLHPRLLEAFVKQLREYTKNQQIIMTTHSPFLLDSLSPEEVWITTRDDQGDSTLTPMCNYPDLERWRDNFNTGEIWMNVAEAQLANTK